MAAGLVLRMQDEGYQLPDAVFVGSPVIDMHLEKYPDYNRRSFRNLIIESGLIVFKRAVYLPYEQWSDPHYSSINGNLKNYPPSFILGGELESLVEPIQAFADKLKANGRNVEIELAPDMDHDFHIMGMGLTPEISIKGFEKVATFLKKVL